jgi:hypothetical protein
MIYNELRFLLVQKTALSAIFCECEEIFLFEKLLKLYESNCLFNLPFLSILEKPSKLLHEDHLQLSSVTHRFAHTALKKCSQLCSLAFLHPLYQDLALMRIVEPASKLRTIELLTNYFEISYSERSVYRLKKSENHKDSFVLNEELLRGANNSSHFLSSIFWVTSSDKVLDDLRLFLPHLQVTV